MDLCVIVYAVVVTGIVCLINKLALSKRNCGLSTNSDEFVVNSSNMKTFWSYILYISIIEIWLLISSFIRIPDIEILYKFNGLFNSTIYIYVTLFLAHIVGQKFVDNRDSRNFSPECCILLSFFAFGVEGFFFFLVALCVPCIPCFYNDAWRNIFSLFSQKSIESFLGFSVSLGNIVRKKEEKLDLTLFFNMIKKQTKRDRCLSVLAIFFWTMVNAVVLVGYYLVYNGSNPNYIEKALICAIIIGYFPFVPCIIKNVKNEVVRKNKYKK